MACRPDRPFAGPLAGIRVTRTAPDPRQRVGDAERNAVAEALSQHYSDGRLDANEMKERLDAAIGAKTWGDLSGLLSNLPPLASPAPPPPPRRRRVAMWIALVAVFLAFSLPWHAGPWPWVPRIPWVVIGLVALVLWLSRRRRHFHPSA